MLLLLNGHKTQSLVEHYTLYLPMTSLIWNVINPSNHCHFSQVLFFFILPLITSIFSQHRITVPSVWSKKVWWSHRVNLPTYTLTMFVTFHNQQSPPIQPVIDLVFAEVWDFIIFHSVLFQAINAFQKRMAESVCVYQHFENDHISPFCKVFTLHWKTSILHLDRFETTHCRN